MNVVSLFFLIMSFNLINTFGCKKFSNISNLLLSLNTISAIFSLETPPFINEDGKFLERKSFDYSLNNISPDTTSKSTVLYPKLLTIDKTLDLPLPIGPVITTTFLSIDIRISSY